MQSAVCGGAVCSGAMLPLLLLLPGLQCQQAVLLVAAGTPVLRPGTNSLVTTWQLQPALGFDYIGRPRSPWCCPQA